MDEERGRPTIPKDRDCRLSRHEGRGTAVRDEVGAQPPETLGIVPDHGLRRAAQVGVPADPGRRRSIGVIADREMHDQAVGREFEGLPAWKAQGQSSSGGHSRGRSPLGRLRGGHAPGPEMRSSMQRVRRGCGMRPERQGAAGVMEDGVPNAVRIGETADRLPPSASFAVRIARDRAAARVRSRRLDARPEAKRACRRRRERFPRSCDLR